MGGQGEMEEEGRSDQIERYNEISCPHAEEEERLRLRKGAAGDGQGGGNLRIKSMGVRHGSRLEPSHTSTITFGNNLADSGGTR